MRRRRLLIVVLLVVAGLGFLAWRNADRLPPRRPYKVARVVSGLPVPRDSRVLEFRDQWGGMTGDGEVKLVLQLTPAQFERVRGPAGARGYRELGSGGADRQVVASLVGQPVTGMYRLSGSADADYELVVLDPGTRRMYVLLGVQ